jgi:hypothetical protein
MDRRSATAALALALILICVCCCCLSFSQVDAAGSSLEIKVLNANKTPIAGATVTISGPVNKTLVTGANGIVLFSNIPSGTYDIVTSTPDYPSSSPQTVLVNGQTQQQVLFGFIKAIYSYTPQRPTVNQTITFNATSSTSSAEITDYTWDFGDGTTATGITPTHSYTKTGRYTVLLTVTNNVGTATYLQNITVSVPAQEAVWFPWILLLLPLLLLILLLFWRRRRYYVIIQARVPLQQQHPHCPGDGTKCEDCKVTPC